MPLALTLENGTTYFLERNGQISEDPCGDVLVCRGERSSKAFCPFADIRYTPIRRKFPKGT